MFLPDASPPSPLPLPSPVRAAQTRGPQPWESVNPDVLTTLSDEITSFSAHLDTEVHRLLRLIAEFDRLEGWKREGFASCVEWLAYSTHIDKMTAREKVRVARGLARLPETSAAMARGELSFSQARAITRVADAESETELLGFAAEMSAAALERLVRSWRRPGQEDEAAAEARRHASRSFSVCPDGDGSYVVRGRLDPEVGVLLMRAIEAGSDALCRGSIPETTPEQRRADALGLLVERAFAAGFQTSAVDERTDDAGRGSSTERYMVVIHVAEGVEEGESASGSRLPSLEDGTRVSAETARRVACDASVVQVGGAPGQRSATSGEATTNGPSRSRTVPPRMRRALQLRDRGCRFPGCGSRFTDAHHIRHWAEGGSTRLENLVLLCRVHHRLIHEGGFGVEPNPGRPGRPDFINPRGFRIPETPPRMRVGGRWIGGSQSRWEEGVSVALYLSAVAAAG